jgi:hypothetical protein
MRIRLTPAPNSHLCPPDEAAVGGAAATAVMVNVCVEPEIASNTVPARKA